MQSFSEATLTVCPPTTEKAMPSLNHTGCCWIHVNKHLKEISKDWAITVSSDFEILLVLGGLVKMAVMYGVDGYCEGHINLGGGGDPKLKSLK